MDKKIKKRCCRCKKIKEIDSFGKRKDVPSGKMYECKSCVSFLNKKKRRTKNGVISNLYSRQLGSCRQRGHNPPNYDLDKLREWCLNNDKFHFLYDEWVESGYKKEKKPSIDRIDNSKTYSFENIQLITWRENNEKAHRELRRKVGKYNLSDVLIKEYDSLKSAQKDTGINYTNISKVCSGKRKKSGGFKWKYI